MKILALIFIIGLLYVIYHIKFIIKKNSCCGSGYGSKLLKNNNHIVL